MENGNLKALVELKNLLIKGKVIRFADWSDEFIDSMLDARENSEFETEWLRVFNNLEAELSRLMQQSLIAEIREIAHRKTYDLTKHAELAGYVADDFELIAKSFSLGYADEWLNSLFLSYLHGVFPHTKLAPKKNGLELILETLVLHPVAA